MDGAVHAASVALIEGDRVLLIQRAQAPYFGLWSLPGGRIEPGETPEACAIREIGEELGLACHALRPVTRLRLGDGGFVLQVFGTEGFAGEIAPSAEVADWRWMRAGRWEGLALTPHLPDVLQLAFRMFERR